MKKLSLLAIFLLSLAGCGGGGGGSGTTSGTAGSGSGGSVDFPPLQQAPTAGALTNSAPYQTLANICTVDGEKAWVRAYLDDIYLWYKEIVNVSPSQYPTVEDYFYALLVKSKDRFSFTAPKGEIDQFFQAGEEVGYGARFVKQSGKFRVSYTVPNSPADQQKVTRGVQIIGINGVPIGLVSASDQIRALYPSTAGETHTFEVLDVGATTTRTVRLTAAQVAGTPVQTRVITTDDQKKIGYMLFTDHVATAEDPLTNAMAQFQRSGISDLVLDVRYNGGGYLYIASELASMIGGDAVRGKIFEQLQFNDKHPERTNDPNAKVPFYDGNTKGQALPQLNLKRVYVLTGPGTCSASESIVNGLSPFVQVITIGGTTCGKPYGFLQEDNCGTAYFAIQFVGVNAVGKGDYANGFAPTCALNDDLEHALGDTSERLLAGAISYSRSGACPAAGATQATTAAYRPEVLKDAYRAPWRENRLFK